MAERTVGACCHECEIHVDIPLSDITLRDCKVVAVCPIGKHYSTAPVSGSLAYKLTYIGVRSLAEEASEFLAQVAK